MKAGDEYTAVYVICGLSLGRTDVVATAVQHGKKNLVTSDAREIQVCHNILLWHYTGALAAACIQQFVLLHFLPIISFSLPVS